MTKERKLIFKIKIWLNSNFKISKSSLKKEKEEEERRVRQEEIVKKNLEKQQRYFEKHQKKCEKVRLMFNHIMDPANLHKPTTTNAATSPQDDSSLYPSVDPLNQLSSAISGVLQPCNLLNKILADVIGLIPQTQSAQTGKYF